MKHILEIACFNITSALLVAQTCDRIELCDNYHLGGITVSHTILKQIRKQISIPIFPIIRPRGGDFFYTDEEFEIMKNDVKLCKTLNYEGIVFGILNKNKSIDIKRTSELVELAYPLQTTFHRAFDEAIDPFRSLEDIIDCGCTRILTSGQKPNAQQGIALIKQLIELANNNIIIMPGGNLRSTNIAEIAVNTGASAFHSSAKKETIQNDSIISIDMNEVKNMRSILESLP